ncbi:hypothetical protein HDU98_001506, partial [Podochytrium sp. JEL0797]
LPFAIAAPSPSAFTTANQNNVYIQLGTTNLCWTVAYDWRTSTNNPNNNNPSLSATPCSPGLYTQQFNVTVMPNNAVQITNTGYCTRVYGGISTNGTRLVSHGCGSPPNGAPYDQYNLNTTSGPTLQYVGNTKLCVMLAGTGLQTQPCPASTASSAFTFNIVQTPVLYTCSEGSSIQQVAPLTSASTPIVANPGTKFGNIPWNGNNSFYSPTQFVVGVYNNGVPQPWCYVTWTTRNNDLVNNGWLLSVDNLTDSNGQATAYWVAGNATNQFLDVSIDGLNGTAATTTCYGSTTLMPGLRAGQAPYVYYHTASLWQQFSVDVTPLTMKPTTYYEVIGLNSLRTYGGMQTGNVLIFSVWGYYNTTNSTQYIWPVTLRSVAGAKCGRFGGEGTGNHCLYTGMPLPVNSTFNFVNTVASATINGAQGMQYTMTVTAKSTGVSIELASFFLPGVINEFPSGGYAFVEDFGRGQHSCLLNAPRAVHLGNITYQAVGASSWQDMPISAGGLNDATNPCANWNSFSDSTGFTMAAGGFNNPYNADYS